MSTLVEQAFDFALWAVIVPVFTYSSILAMLDFPTPGIVVNSPVASMVSISVGISPMIRPTFR